MLITESIIYETNFFLSRMTQETKKTKKARPREIDAEVYNDFADAVARLFPRDKGAMKRESEKAFTDATKKLKRKLEKSRSKSGEA